MIDFKKASHTVIISDLHLCDAEPIHPKFPLWKKYKTKEFFYDEELVSFLDLIQEKSRNESIELVLNGDIFDFDSCMSIPTHPTFQISWLERKRGLYPRSERSVFKIQQILKDHTLFLTGLRNFILRGNRLVIVIGNHDLEMHFSQVQKEIILSLNLPEELQSSVRIVEWFYISNQDTLIEHGNQYDPYCVCEDPVNPFVKSYNYLHLKIPFGNLATRYMINGMGFFNPHSDANYIMTLSEYIRFFMKYMFRAQPDLIFVWFFGSITTLFQSFISQLGSSLKNPLTIEDKIEKIALKSNAEARMVRELREVFVNSAARNPFLLMRELWLDRAFLLLIGFFLLYQIMTSMRSLFGISIWWGLLLALPLPPFFLFYSKSITSRVSAYKEVDEKILSTLGAITKVNRVVFGHTHIPRHEIVGAIEHLNSGTWSPAFTDVECTQSVDKKTYIWISKEENSDERAPRKAELCVFESNSKR